MAHPQDRRLALRKGHTGDCGCVPSLDQSLSALLHLAALASFSIAESVLRPGHR